MKPAPHIERKRPIELIEEAVHLVRQASTRTLALYFIGTVPFVLGLLYFWADMTRGALAYTRCGALSLALVGLYGWMRCWQVLFCRALYRLKSGDERPGLPVREWAAQLQWATWSLLALGVSAFLMIPYAWTYAFHQNLAAQPAEAGSSGLSPFARSREQARRWPIQNHYVIGLLGLFRVLVFVNVATALFLAPFLLKMLLGIATPLTRHVYWMANTTFLAAAAGLTYLCTDPIVKAVYVLRCYYGEAIRTGRDLLVDLNRIRSARRGVTALGLAFVLLPGVLSAQADVSTNLAWPTVHAVERNAESGFPTADFDQAVQEVSARPVYAWKMPRDIVPEDPDIKKSFLRDFFDQATLLIKKGLKAVGRALERFARWISRWLRWRNRQEPERPMGGWNTQALQTMAWSLLLVLLIAGGWYVWHVYRHLQRKGLSATMTPLAPVPDLEDEHVLASQLPEDEWRALAACLAAEGDWRKALRAWFMAALAFLGRSELIEIVKFKSNLDYLRELDRRGKRYPGVAPAFADGIRLFERGWYGMHPVSRAEVEAFEKTVTRMKSGVQT